MQRHKPTFTYKGLTVILSNPSRFDNVNLLSAKGGRLFDDFLRPEFNRCQVDIRVKEDTSPLLPDTKCILLLGEPAAKMWAKIENPLCAVRGSVYWYDGHMTKDDCKIPMICSFFPQDAADLKNFEREFNPHALQLQSDDEFEDDERESDTDAKGRHGKTKRRNYRFWLERDIRKVKQILKSGVPPRPFEPEYIIYPKSETVNRVLRENKGTDFHIDLETWYPDPYLKCFAFSFGYGNPIYCVPVYLWNNSWAYTDLPEIFFSLAIAMRDNVTVAHNGQCFDFVVLPWKCGVPLGRRMYDTMIAQHRCFSSVEKSLGHCTSLWTWEPFHKDEGDVGYSSAANAMQTWKYCCKDVYTMVLIKKAIDDYAKTVPNLTESISRANNAIRPYITSMLQGIGYKEEILQETMRENDRLMMHYLSWLDILIGEKNLDIIKGKSKKGMPGSNSQCVKYFHEMLHYPVVDYGDETKKGTRNPKLGRKQLLKLKLKVENPVLDIVMAYRELAKESGSLKFTPWKKDDEINIRNG